MYQMRASHRRLRVVRVETTTDNHRIVGLHIPNPAVEAVRIGAFMYMSFSQVMLKVHFFL